MASVRVPSQQQADAGTAEHGDALEQGDTRPAPGAGLSPVRAPAARAPRPLRRRPDQGLLGGVCAGVAEHHGVEVAVVRLLMAMLVAVGGIGLAIYALAWALIPVAPESEGVPRRPGAWREAVLIVLAVIGLLVGMRVSGFRFGDKIVWPLVLAACGAALVWRPVVRGESRSDRRGWRARAGHVLRARRVDAPRVGIGGLLVVFASASLLHTFGVLHSLGNAIGAVGIIATVVGLLTVPWFVRLARSLAFERSARIREQERAEVAAHLHDSVLQTLALIQKRSGDPREVAGLARRQERELRRWLHERPQASDEQTVAGALERAAAEVEELHRVPIEVVTVGDGSLDERLGALVAAAREAMTNAAKFSGCERVDLYAEVEPHRVQVFVRDRGAGFDPQAIPPDRRGVRDSIIARVERHGGRARVHSSPGQGTEVELAIGTGATV